MIEDPALAASSSGGLSTPGANPEAFPSLLFEGEKARSAIMEWDGATYLLRVVFYESSNEQPRTTNSKCNTYYDNIILYYSRGAAVHGWQYLCLRFMCAGGRRGLPTEVRRE